MCCCVRAERAVHAPGDTRCAPRALAHRLRRIGDALHKSWATGDPRDHPSSEQAGRGSGQGWHLLCAAIQVTALALLRWRHL